MDGLLRNRIESLTGETVASWKRVSGGDISQTFRVETRNGPLFCKWHSGKQGPVMLASEAAGLRAIARTNTLRTPEVYHYEGFDDGALLIMEYIASRDPSSSEMTAFGEALALLHGIPQPYFGWESDNFIGSLHQYNGIAKMWFEFFPGKRLLPQLAMARDSGRLKAEEIPGENRILNVCRDVMAEVEPSLLHGDLWAGNYLIATDGQPVVIDPAVHYGHSEVDLAMSRLFGGFSPAFYQGYDSCRAARAGSRERQDLYQLYYLLVHLNLFGASYRAPVLRILRTYFGP